MALASSTSIPTLLFAAFAAVSLAGCGLSVTLDGDTSRRTEEETVPADGIRIIDVRSENGAVEIRGGSDGDITIQSILRERRDGDARASYRIDGDRLVIDGDCDQRWWEPCSVGFVVTLPPDLDVRVATDAGRVEVFGMNGDLHIETANGAIDAAALGDGSVSAETDNGRVRLTFDEVPSDVHADTDNGAITIRLPDDGDLYAVDADTDNGAIDIEVETDPDAGRRIVARSDNGSIDVGYRTT